MQFGFAAYVRGKAWDIATLIANCTRPKAYGVEMRTSINSANGVELEANDARRREETLCG